MTLEEVSWIATAVSLPLAVAAVLYSAYQTSLARRATAASMMLSATSAFSEAWRAFGEAQTAKDQESSFADILNLLEACCASHRDGLSAGHSGAVLTNYLVAVLVDIDSEPRAIELFKRLLETKTTFDEIRRFLAKMRGKRANRLARLTEAAGPPASLN
ncbi:hypothetical protein [Devosia sp. Root105]|uniref:hypothetical protein n=1 Tax=Devosia sp. Root105 TaxID=1736423 RepID=UPI0006F564B0|nr:hypothetical protein [Devosia sp. Root105]KQU96441.1 hypothetical protein ASC68_13770 [Devosia sp. Root105]